MSENFQQRITSAGWSYFTIDGHDFEQIDDAFTKAKLSDKPCFIACKTMALSETRIN